MTDIARDGSLPPDVLPEGASRDFPHELLEQAKGWHSDFQEKGRVFADKLNDEKAAADFQTAAMEAIGKVFDTTVAALTPFIAGKLANHPTPVAHANIKDEVKNAIFDSLSARMAGIQNVDLITTVLKQFS